MSELAHGSVAPAAKSRAPRWPWLLGAAFGLLYLVSYPVRSDGIVNGNDVVNYADCMVGDSGYPLLSLPNHLGYHGLCTLVYRALLAWPGTQAGIALGLLAQQLVAAAGGALTVAAVATLSLRVASWHVALPLACCLGFTHGVWWSAAIGDSYVPALGATAWLLCTALEPATLGTPHRKLALGAWLVAAAVIRQDSLLVLPALAMLVPWRALVPVVAGAGAVALAVYGAAWAVSSPVESFSEWLVGLVHTPHAPWGAGWSGDGSRLALRHLGCMLQAAEWDKPGTSVATLGLIVLATLFAWPWTAARLRGALACVVHALTCFAFYAWWEAGNMEYQTPLLLPLACAFALLGAGSSGGWRRALRAGLLGAAALAILAGTWFFGIRPYRSCGMSEHSRLALEAAGPHGMIFSLDVWQEVALLRERRLVLGDALTGIKLHDVHGAAAPGKPAETEALRRWVQNVSRRGYNAVVIGDLVLPPAQIGPDRADPRVIQEMLRDLRHTPVLDENGVVVAQRVEAETR